MPDSKLYPAILLIFSCLSFNLHAGNNSTSFINAQYQNLITQNQVSHYTEIKSQFFIKKHTKISNHKLSMVLSPDDFITVSSQHYWPDNIDNQVTVENSPLILGFYVQSFF